MATLYRSFFVFVATTLLLGSTVTFGLTINQTDTFTGGTTDNWQGGAGLVNVASGGPSGSGDAFLQVASGPGAASRLITFNQTQWIGDFLAAGVNSVQMDLKNFGSTSLSMRIAIREGTGPSGTPGYASTTPFSLPADNSWHTAVFSLTAGAMTPINSPQAFATDIASVQDFRILDSASPSTIGDAITAQIGVDNITAVSVPEPASVVLVLGGFLGMWAYSTCRKQP